MVYAPAASAFVVVLFLESKRAPFDHAETESEVVAGYATEYNGPMLLMIFLAEYLHLIISALHFILFFVRRVYWYNINRESWKGPQESRYISLVQLANSQKIVEDPKKGNPGNGQ